MFIGRHAHNHCSLMQMLIQRWLENKDMLGQPEQVFSEPALEAPVVSIEESEPAAAAALPPGPLMTDLLMEFDMDSNF